MRPPPRRLAVDQCLEASKDRFEGTIDGTFPLSPPPLPTPKEDPAVLKILQDSELLHCSVFYYAPPYLPRCETLFECKNACKTQENCASAAGVAIANHCAIVNVLRIVQRAPNTPEFAQRPV